MSTENKPEPSKQPSDETATDSPSRPTHCLSMLLMMHEDGRGDLAKEIAAGWAKEHQEYLKKNGLK